LEETFSLLLARHQRISKHANKEGVFRKTSNAVLSHIFWNVRMKESTSIHPIINRASSGFWNTSPRQGEFSEEIDSVSLGV
jgi:hypothetical protein